MIEFVSYQLDYAADFYKINAEWIEDMFQLEPLDRKVLEDPQTHIIDPGGFIWFAKTPELGIVGTCALRKMGPNEFELTKMGVLKKARGLKLGEKLLQHVIGFVKEQNITCCYLLTNKNCEAAIHLYEKNGFVHDTEVMNKYGCDYQRCDVAMRLRTQS